jgi:hypothetical protein
VNAKQVRQAYTTQLTLHHQLATGGNADYLAWVIHEYVTRPDRRSAVGTTAELRRLTAVPDR